VLTKTFLPTLSCPQGVLPVQAITKKARTMKQIIKTMTRHLSILALFLASCSKQVDKGIPQPIPEPQANGLQLAFALPANAPINPDTAVLVLQTGSEEKTLRLKLTQDQQQWKTGFIQLPTAGYKLVQAKLTSSEGKFVYAIPTMGSAKASMVQHSLPYTIPANSTNAVATMQVVAISAADKATHFGYPANAFDRMELIYINLQASINIGGYVYDHIDGQVDIQWFDQQQQPHNEMRLLNAGLNKIGLPKEATRFHFTYKKWHVLDEMELPASAITHDLTITMGGAIAARKLKEEFTWQEVMGEYQPFSKKTYEYNAIGQVVKAIYYQKIPQHQELQLQQIETFTYANGRLININYYDNTQKQTGFLKFTYANNGLITYIEQNKFGEHTYAAVSYSIAGGLKEVTIDYAFNNGAMEYKFTMDKGNKIREGGAGSNGGYEGGSFSYDMNINPYHVMGLQDVYLRHLNKNNQLSEQKTYQGNIPTNVPYAFDYQYDAKGYPTQLIKKFKSYSNQTHLYSSKTQYTYLD